MNGQRLSGGEWKPQALTWGGINVDNIQVAKADGSGKRCLWETTGSLDHELNCVLGFGLLLPCCYFVCCKGYAPDYYTITIPSKTTHREGSGKHRRTVLDAWIELKAMAGDADTIVNLIKQRSGSLGGLVEVPKGNMER